MIVHSVLICLLKSLSVHADNFMNSFAVSDYSIVHNLMHDQTVAQILPFIFILILKISISVLSSNSFKQLFANQNILILVISIIFSFAKRITTSNLTLVFAAQIPHKGCLKTEYFQQTK